jgi:hypothetical protein
MKELILKSFLQTLILLFIISSCFARRIAKRNDLLNRVVSNLSDDEIRQIDTLSRKKGIQ